MLLARAHQIASAIVKDMRPFCERVEVVGSVRRRKCEPRDIEIVCIPKWEDRPGDDLFGSPVKTNVLHADWSTIAHAESYLKWIKPGTDVIEPWPLKPEGKYWRGLLNNNAKLDLFIASPKNWGVILCLRTSSADFSRELVTYARDNTNYHVQGGHLIDARGFVDGPEEIDLFEALKVEWVEPEKRTGGQVHAKAT